MELIATIHPFGNLAYIDDSPHKFRSVEKIIAYQAIWRTPTILSNAYDGKFICFGRFLI